LVVPVVAIAAFFTWSAAGGCSDDDETAITSSGAGAAAGAGPSGGAGSPTTSSTASGGGSSTTTTASGGAGGTGGASTGGAPTGGAPTGGAPTGGTSSDGGATSSGTAGAGGSLSCERQELDCSSCVDCAVASECAAEEVACENSPDCVALDACIAADCIDFSDVACIEWCSGQYQNGVALHYAWHDCLFCTACANDCSELGYDCTASTSCQPQSIDCDACIDCSTLTDCTAEEAAFSMNADAIAIDQCIITVCATNYGDAPCVAACEQAHPTGIADFHAIATCTICGTCPGDCAGLQYPCP
jgi:hypothetical protein